MSIYYCKRRDTLTGPMACCSECERVEVGGQPFGAGERRRAMADGVTQESASTTMTYDEAHGYIGLWHRGETVSTKKLMEAFAVVSAILFPQQHQFAQGIPCECGHPLTEHTVMGHVGPCEVESCNCAAYLASGRHERA